MAKDECSCYFGGVFFPPHLAVGIYQPSFPTTKYFFGAKTSIKSQIYIFKILTAQKDPSLPEKARSKFGQHFLLAQVAK